MERGELYRVRHPSSADPWKSRVFVLVGRQAVIDALLVRHLAKYGMAEPTAPIDAIGVEQGSRRRGAAHALLVQFRRTGAAIGVSSIRTEVAWSDFLLLAFLRAEGCAPAPRLCLETAIDPTE